MYLIVLDFQSSGAYEYPLPKDFNFNGGSVERFLGEKGHNINSCQWIVSSNFTNTQAKLRMTVEEINELSESIAFDTMLSEYPQGTNLEEISKLVIEDASLYENGIVVCEAYDTYTDEAMLHLLRENSDAAKSNLIPLID